MCKSGAQVTFTKTDHVLSHKANLNKFHRGEIIKIISSVKLQKKLLNFTKRQDTGNSSRKELTFE